MFRAHLSMNTSALGTSRSCRAEDTSNSSSITSVYFYVLVQLMIVLWCHKYYEIIRNIYTNLYKDTNTNCIKLTQIILYLVLNQARWQGPSMTSCPSKIGSQHIGTSLDYFGTLNTCQLWHLPVPCDFGVFCHPLSQWNLCGSPRWTTLRPTQLPTSLCTCVKCLGRAAEIWQMIDKCIKHKRPTYPKLNSYLSQL